MVFRQIFPWPALGLAALLLAATALALPVPPKVRAALQGESREAFDRGTVLYARGEYLTAREAFVAAHLSSREPRVLYNVAVCDKALGRYRAATESLRASLANPGALPEAYVRLGTDTLAVLERKLAHIVIETNVSAELFVDGDPAQSPHAVDPGRHVVEARLAGHQGARETIDVVEAQRLLVRLVLAPEPAPRAAAPRPARLRVFTADAADRIQLDGVVQPTNRVDATVQPGDHRVEVHRGDASTREFDLVLQPGETRDLRVTLAERSAPKAWPWIVGGGAVLLTAAAITAALLATRSTEYVGASPGFLDPGVVTASVPYSGGAK